MQIIAWSFPKVAFQTKIVWMPSKVTIQKLKSYGCFFIKKKGSPLFFRHRFRMENIFFSHERNLMFNLTDVKHNCYVVLKILNRYIIQLKHISSFHWKTCLLYVIEENEKNCWKNERLFHSVTQCIKIMLNYVRCGFCPNYFIPEDNVFDGKLTASWRFLFENLLQEIFNIGFDCFFMWNQTNCGIMLNVGYSATGLKYIMNIVQKSIR